MTKFNKFNKFCNDTLVNYYKNRMHDYFKESHTAHKSGDYERASELYQRYLKFKDKFEKCQKK